MRLTPRDCLDAGFCIDGQRRFCNRHGIDFRSFVKSGLPESAFDGIVDANLSRALAVGRARLLSEEPT